MSANELRKEENTSANDASRKDEFREKLRALLNRYCMENDSDTPDFILADHLIACLEAFDKTTKRRDSWYSPEDSHDTGAAQAARR